MVVGGVWWVLMVEGGTRGCLIGEMGVDIRGRHARLFLLPQPVEEDGQVVVEVKLFNLDLPLDAVAHTSAASRENLNRFSVHILGVTCARLTQADRPSRRSGAAQCWVGCPSQTMRRLWAL